MKKKYTILTIIIILFVTTFIGFKSLKQNVYEEENKNKPTRITKGISMNLEQTAGAGDYKTVTQSTWPTDGYIFNKELSRCENGSALSWDDTKEVVIVSGNLSDKCYVYFDKYMPASNLADACDSGNNLATCITSFANAVGSSISNIYYHNGNLGNGAGDNSYRYSGANPNNYVCFGSDASSCPADNLYRIIGVIDGKVKLIKADFASSTLLGTNGDYGSSTTPASTYKGSLTSVNTYYWNSSDEQNTWSIALLNTTNLNTNFINNLSTTWSNKLVTTTWKVGGGLLIDIIRQIPSMSYQNEITTPASTTTYNAKIGLMYVSDYGFATDPSAWTLTLENYNNTTAINSNWMYIGHDEWTITRDSDGPDSEFRIDKSGIVSSDLGTYNSNGVRPVFNLESSVTYVSGDGTQSSPIRIN